MMGSLVDVSVTKAPVLKYRSAVLTLEFLRLLSVIAFAVGAVASVSSGGSETNFSLAAVMAALSANRYSTEAYCEVVAVVDSSGALSRVWLPELPQAIKDSAKHPSSG